jgi:hypothetical protein
VAQNKAHGALGRPAASSARQIDQRSTQAASEQVAMNAV